MLSHVINTIYADRILIINLRIKLDLQKINIELIISKDLTDEVKSKQD